MANKFIKLTSVWRRRIAFLDIIYDDLPERLNVQQKTIRNWFYNHGQSTLIKTYYFDEIETLFYETLPVVHKAINPPPQKPEPEFIPEIDPELIEVLNFAKQAINVIDGIEV